MALETFISIASPSSRLNRYNDMASNKSLSSLI